MSTQIVTNAEVTGSPGLDTVALDGFLDSAGRGGSQEVLCAAAHGMAALLGERGICVLLDSGPRVVFSTHKSSSGSPIDLDRYPEVKAAVAARDIVVVDDVATNELLESVRADLPASLVSVVAVPLVVEDRCLGAVLVQSSRPPGFDSIALATARLMARFTALLLGRLAADGVVTSPAPDESTGSTRIAIGGVKSSRILIIDDDDDASANLADLLAAEGYRVERAGDGEDGIRRALDEVPDLVLLDVNLPGMTGFEAATRLRLLTQTRGVPILFLSGTDRLPAQVRGAALEHVDFMLKPFSADELLTRIHQAVVQSEKDRRLQLAADHDELTGVGNLRCLRRRLKLERSLFERYGHPLSIAMIDVDKLKTINDEHGHVVGSEILRGIGKALARQARDSDLVARYGGDEFVVLLPHTTLAQAERFANRVLTEVAEIEVQGAHVTVSIGVACLTAQGGPETNEDLLRRADRVAYQSKRRGGNCVCVAAVD